MCTSKKVFLPFILIIIFVCGCEEKSELIQDIKSVKDFGKNTSCKENMMCREDNDCIDGKCVQGVCHCQSIFCQKDEDCEGNRCCNILNGVCYDCIKDIFNGEGEDISYDILSEVGDIEENDDGDIEDIVVVGCESDLNCNIEKPYCNTQIKVCVECYEDKHCRGGMCNKQTGECILYPDTGYDVETDAILDAIMDAGSDPCLNYSCICGSICMVIDGNPKCVAGCKIDSDCCANTVCKNGKCEKTTCSDDTDCKDVSKPHCEVITGICYECTNDLHCQSNYYCDGNHVCKYKVDECFGACNPNTQWCNPVKKQCEDIPQNWCANCTELLDPICLFSSLTCGITTKKCTKKCSDDSECFGFTCNIFGWCSCP